MHQVTIACDGCEVEYMLHQEMELPPSWIGVQIVIADIDGIIPEQEEDIFNHFCSVKCLGEFCEGNDLRRRVSYVNRGNKKRKRRGQPPPPPTGDEFDGHPPDTVG